MSKLNKKTANELAFKILSNDISLHRISGRRVIYKPKSTSIQKHDYEAVIDSYVEELKKDLVKEFVELQIIKQKECLDERKAKIKSAYYKKESKKIEDRIGEIRWRMQIVEQFKDPIVFKNQFKLAHYDFF